MMKSSSYSNLWHLGNQMTSMTASCVVWSLFFLWCFKCDWQKDVSKKLDILAVWGAAHYPEWLAGCLFLCVFQIYEEKSVLQIYEEKKLDIMAAHYPGWLASWWQPVPPGFQFLHTSNSSLVRSPHPPYTPSPPLKKLNPALIITLPAPP